MDIESQDWREEYMTMRQGYLSPYQIRMLAAGPKSLATAWMLQAMHHDWKNLKSQNYESGNTTDNVED